MNIKFLIIAYLAGLFVDWVFQTDWQATNKSKWGKGDDKRISLIALLSHSIYYAILTTSVTALLLADFSHIKPIFLTLFITHFIIDSRIPVKWVMRLKRMSWKQINDYQNFGFMHVGIDQRLHELVLIILAWFV
jgi:hypothetical protein